MSNLRLFYIAFGCLGAIGLGGAGTVLFKATPLVGAYLLVTSLSWAAFVFLIDRRLQSEAKHRWKLKRTINEVSPGIRKELEAMALELSRISDKFQSFQAQRQNTEPRVSADLGNQDYVERAKIYHRLTLIERLLGTTVPSHSNAKKDASRKD